MYLQEFNSELPPCFKAWCDCGWKGRFLSGTAYIMGVCAPIDSAVYLYPKRPSCGVRTDSSRFHRASEREDFYQRFRWVMANKSSQLIGREGDPFPCTCQAKSSCQVAGEIHLSTTIVGDTCFISDRPWVRVAARVKCNGCYATGVVCWIEGHNPGDLFRVEDRWFEKLQSYHGPYIKYRRTRHD